MMKKFLEIPAEKNILPLSYTLMSSGVLILSDDESTIGRLYHIKINDEWKNYYVLYIGPLNDRKIPDLSQLAPDQEIIVRIDSGCLTGMVFGDRTCDCHDQLQISIGSAVKNGVGFIIHVPSQDGRGMGVDFKLKTLDEQFYNGLNTVESAKTVSHLDNIDRRTYQGAVGCLKFLGVAPELHLNIATNNPEKIKAFKATGYYNINTSRVMAQHLSDSTKKHLSAKQQFLGHLK